jgi:hypothetical protein
MEKRDVAIVILTIAVIVALMTNIVTAQENTDQEGHELTPTVSIVKGKNVDGSDKTLEDLTDQYHDLCGTHDVTVCTIHWNTGRAGDKAAYDSKEQATQQGIEDLKELAREHKKNAKKKVRRAILERPGGAAALLTGDKPADEVTPEELKLRGERVKRLMENPQEEIDKVEDQAREIMENEEFRKELREVARKMGHLGANKGPGGPFDWHLDYYLIYKVAVCQCFEINLACELDEVIVKKTKFDIIYEDLWS